MSSNVVISKLAGGLGNQMFQYACGYAVARRLQATLLLDTTFLKLKPDNANYTLRDFELDVFRLRADLASSELTAPYISNQRSLLQRVMRKLKGPPAGYFKEDSKLYHSGIELLSSPVYLDGYWQNEKYFNAYRHDILTLFEPGESPSGMNEQLAREIRDVHAICVHVRRGDYVSNPSAHQLHGTCSPQYYAQAAQLLVEKISDPVFYVFSDDIHWVQNHIQFPGTTRYIGHNTGKSSHWDLYLMKLGKAHIIANSSFSWWGAWLCENPGQLVVAPSHWFQGIDEYEITPAAWMLV